MPQPWIVRIHRRESLGTQGKSGAFFAQTKSFLLAAPGQAQSTPRFHSSAEYGRAQTQSGLKTQTEFRQLSIYHEVAFQPIRPVCPTLHCSR